MQVELLAPAGSFDSLKAAVAAGADAVYIGGTRFGARAYADNLTEEELLEAIDYCHFHGCCLYLTVNTLLKDKEMDELYDYLLPYYERGLDAVIVQDLGVFSFLRHSFPDLPIHASTQMTLCGVEGAKLMESLGATRIVTARELSLEEIVQIHRETTVEIESFVHGALCYCYSGQCLYSSLLGGRSGNRGRCAQPCRLDYQQGNAKGFLLSPKDICTLEILPQILEAGVYSLKIEGRMKRPEYTAGVVRIYRKYLDHYLKHGKKGYRVLEEDKRELMALYNRGGFTTGYYRTRNGRDMMSMKRANHYGTESAKVVRTGKKNATLQALEDLHKGDVLEDSTLSMDVRRGTSFTMSITPERARNLRPGTILHRTRDEELLNRLNKRYLQTPLRENIKGNLRISWGEPVILKVQGCGVSVTVKGAIPEPSMNQPLQSERIRKQLNKTGNTPFDFESLEIEAEEGLFLTMQSLNELRRAALSKLEDKILSSRRRKTASEAPSIPVSDREEWQGHKLSASVETYEQWKALCQVKDLERIYVDWSALPVPLKMADVQNIIDESHQAGRSCYYILPAIFRADTKERYEKQEVLDALALFDGVLFKNYEEYEFLREREYPKELIPDANVYTYNRFSTQFWREQGVTLDTAPVELNSRELEIRGCHNSEVLVYGHLPMMVSAQCLQKNTEGCTKRPGILFMKDRMGKRFPVRNQCTFCYNIIYNQVPLSLFENKKELDSLKPAGLRLSFTVESPEEALSIAGAFGKKYIQGRDDFKFECKDFTRGHFKRGVQ